MTCTCSPCVAASIYSDHSDEPCRESSLRAPLRWQESIPAVVAGWLRDHPGLPVYDAADVVLGLGLVWAYGEDLHAIAVELRASQRALAVCDACNGSGDDDDERPCHRCDGTGQDHRVPLGRWVPYGHGGERGIPRCPVCMCSRAGCVECPDCGVTLRRALEDELAASLAAEEE